MADSLSAAIAGIDLSPGCHVHQSAEIAAVAEAERRDAIVTEGQNLQDALDKVRAETDARVAQAAADDAAAERERQLDELDPLAGSVARAVGAPMTATSSMPLNASAGSIASMLGMGV